MPKVTMVGAGSAVFAHQNKRTSQVLADAQFDCSFRTATPVINRANWWHSMTLSELRSPFLNGAQRSVNRKVQGSNPCPGANL